MSRIYPLKFIIIIMSMILFVNIYAEYKPIFETEGSLTEPHIYIEPDLDNETNVNFIWIYDLSVSSKRVNKVSILEILKLVRDYIEDPKSGYNFGHVFVTTMTVIENGSKHVEKIYIDQSGCFDIEYRYLSEVISALSIVDLPTKRKEFKTHNDNSFNKFMERDRKNKECIENLQNAAKRIN